MIVAYSGKINSGKDLCGKITQYLTEPKLQLYGTCIDFLNNYSSNHLINYTYTFQIHKYADALKDIICILTGCTRNQLEDIDFKNSKLGDEWIRYGYADGFIKKYIGDAKMGEPIMTNKQCSKEEYEEHYRTNWQTAYKSHFTYRELLQYLGTDLLRNKIHENCWINALMSKYKELEQTLFKADAPIHGIPTEEDEVKHSILETIYPNWIITDVRFENEAKAVTDRAGILIRVNRFNSKYCEAGLNYARCSEVEFQGDILIPINCNTCKHYKQDAHPSETSLDNYPFHYIIDNNGSIEDLILKIKEILIKENII